MFEKINLVDTVIYLLYNTYTFHNITCFNVKVAAVL